MQGALGPACRRSFAASARAIPGSPASRRSRSTSDDVYYPVLLGANFDLLDVDHIEVLRGPQGTLFGRNSLAGALNIVGKQPSTTETTGYAEIDRRPVRAPRRARGLQPADRATNAALMVSGLSKQRKGYVKRLDFTCEMNKRGTPQLAGSFPSAECARHQLAELHGERLRRSAGWAATTSTRGA